MLFESHIAKVTNKTEMRTIKLQ